MTKQKKQQILSGLVAFSFLFSNIVPVSSAIAYAAEDINAQTTADKQAQNLDANMTDQDRAIKDKIEGKNNNSSTNISLKALADEKNRTIKNAQQENDTSATKRRAYYVYDEENNQNIVVQENTCYQKYTTECSQTVTLVRTDNEGKQTTIQYPLNQLQYLSGNVFLTDDMMNQIRNQQISVENYNNPSGTTPNSYSESLRQVYQSNMKANGDIDDSVQLWQQVMTKIAIDANNAKIEKYKKYNKALDELAQAKQDITDAEVAKEQVKKDVLKQDSTKRFVAKISPSIPTTGTGDNITLMLKTKSGKPNDESQYTIKIKFINQNTQKEETLDVLENTEYTLEKAEWNKKPGVRTVSVYYTFVGKGKGEQEKYTVTYNVGNMATSILPDGRNVNNSVVALTANASTIDYLNKDREIGVAGRIVDVAYQDGMCMVQITDAKKDSDIGKYKAVNVATAVADENECTKDKLLGTYANFERVSARKLSDGTYVFMDTSDQGGTNLGWDEDAYDAYEDKIAKDVQDANINGTDGTTLFVGNDGIIHEGLAGRLNVDYVCFKANRSCVSIVKQDDGSAKIAKVDGSEYTQEELKDKGLPNLSSVYVGFDDNGVAYISDMATGKSLTMKSFSEIDRVSSASKGIYPLENLSTPNLDNAISSSYLVGKGKYDESGESKLGTVISSVGNVTLGNVNVVVDKISSITAPLSSVNLSKAPLSDVFNSHLANNSGLQSLVQFITSVKKEVNYHKTN